MKLFKLIKGGTLHTPADEGVKDILIAGRLVAKVAERIDLPGSLGVETFDATGLKIVPGFVDLHVHLIGGGGENGPASRVPEVALSELTEAGITTAAGVLGTDSVSRHPESLLAKVKALNEEGLTAYMYTGSYSIPSCTITGSVKRDVALIDEIVGVKVAISDHRASQLTFEELARLASEARVGGLFAGKPGLVHVHVGHDEKGLAPILDVVSRTEIPIGQFLPTHVADSTSLLDEAVEFAKRGGCIDLTAHGSPARRRKDVDAVAGKILKSGAGLENVTISSDSNGSMPEFDEKGRVVGMTTGKADSLVKTLGALVQSGNMPLSDALTLLTTNPADRLGISGRKGRIAEGMDADLLLLDEVFGVKQVFARGRLMVDNGRAIVKGAFETK